jgi:hypothetical protein
MSSIRRHATRTNIAIAASLFIVAIVSFSGGLFYPQIVSQVNSYSAPNGYSGLIVDYVTVNGPAINGGAYQSSCCPNSICSGLNGFGVDRIIALNQQNPPVIACGFRVLANTTGYLLLIVFNTDWDIGYRVSFSTSSSDKTVTFVSMPDCTTDCIVNPITAQTFRIGFAASADHNSAEYVTLTITVRGFCNC